MVSWAGLSLPGSGALSILRQALNNRGRRQLDEPQFNKSLLVKYIYILFFFLSLHKLAKANIKHISSSSASWPNELETI